MGLTCHIVYGTAGKLDWQRILTLIGEEHALLLLWALQLFAYVYPARTDYVPRWLWDGLWARFRQALDHPDPQSPFRGSLIDPTTFAIDVEEWGLANMSEEHRERRVPKISPVKAA